MPEQSNYEKKVNDSSFVPVAYPMALAPSFPSHPNPWRSYGCGVRWRAYQERALRAFDQALANGHKSFHLVAPPGAGKTLLGLAMAARLERPALALSPNAAIQSQWLSRLEQHWVCLAPDDDGLPQTPACAAEPNGSSLALISLTYQRLSVRTEDGQPHANVAALCAQLRESGVGVIIADECHHLGAHWGACVESLMASLDGPFVVGLTATPMDARDGALLRLLGPPDHEISLPSVVRTGDLAPFQDLCHLVSPSPTEEAQIAGALGRFERVFAALITRDESRPSLDFWCEAMAIEPCTGAGVRLPNIVALLEAEPDLVVACYRYLYEKGREPPVDLPPLPEVYEPPTLSDRQWLAAHYLCAQMRAGTVSPELLSEAMAVFHTWGIDVSETGARTRTGEINRITGHSKAKLDGLLAILRTELRIMGDELAALVLTDFEFPPAERAALSCLDVMDLLTSLADLDALDPVMITGRSFLVDDDLWPCLQREASAFAKAQGFSWDLQAVAEGGYLRISSASSHWNPRTRVAFATHLIEAEVSHCIVGTRSLLGEGWDCVRLNTFVDLTVVSTGVSVNQMRGRTLRLDPERSAKVANNWDVLCLSHTGEAADLRRLAMKHNHLYGVTDDGQIERGLGHIHGFFDSACHERLLDGANVFRETMHRRAEDRGGARARWRIGRSFRDEDMRVLSFAPPRRSQARLTKQATKEAPPRTALMMEPEASRLRRRGWWAVGGAIAASIGLGVAGVSFSWLAWAAPLPALAALAALRRWTMVLTSAPEEAELRNLGAVVAAALTEANFDSEAATVSKRDDGSLRVVFPNLPSAQGERAAEALAELLSPVSRARYLLVERLWQSTSTNARLLLGGKPVMRVFTVPRALARKSQAENLLFTWRQHRTSAVELLHASTQEAQELLQAHFHSRPFAGEVSLHHVWR